MLKNILKHPLLKAGLIYTLCDAVNKAVPFLILPLLSFYLLPSDYGIVANFGLLLAITVVFVGLGVEGIIGVKFYNVSKDKLSTYIFNSIILIVVSSIIVTSLILVFEEQIYMFFKIPKVYMLLIVLMAIATSITTINLALWRLEEKAFQFGIYQVAQTVLNISVSLFLVMNLRLGWVGRVQGMLVATLIFGAFSFFLLVRRGYLVRRFDKTILLSILAFSLPLIPHSLSLWIRSGIDRMYITSMYGESETGLYATGFLFGTLISFVIIAFNNAFVPFLYKSLSVEDKTILKENKIRLKKITFYGIIFLSLIAILFYWFSIFVLNNFFSKDYIDSKEFIFWAIIAQVFQGYYLFFVNYIFYMHKTKMLASITFLCSLIQVALSFYFIKTLGPIGGAYSTAVVSAINFLCVLIYSERIYKMDWFKIKFY